MQKSAIANDSGATKSPWMSKRVANRDIPLGDLSECDVCVIGAGISGLSAAYFLARDGKRVIVLDDGPIGGGETGRTTAHLASALDDRFTRLESLHGEKGARLAARSHSRAIDRIDAISSIEQIDCQFKRVEGYLFNPSGRELLDLEKELAAVQRAGLRAELVERAPIIGFETGKAIRFENQAQFHPLVYLEGLAHALEKGGGRIVTGIHVEKIEEEGGCRVITDGGKVINAAFVVVATNAPINSMVELPMKQAAYRSYAISMVVPRAQIAPGLYWDTEDPYHYVRLMDAPRDDGADLLIVGGEDHKTGQEDDGHDRFDKLEAWARERFPMAAEVSHRWSGQVLEPVDGLGFAGLTPGSQRVFLISGDSGHGLTHGTLGGELVSDLILGRKNEWATLYDPSRKTLRALGTFASEGANTFAQYADLLKGSDEKSIDDIPRGAGAVMRRGLKQIAVYRDQGGECHERSAICPHLGAVVAWNHAERSWDCPCHGSRFDPMGRVIAGPAVADLEPLDDPAKQPTGT